MFSAPAVFAPLFFWFFFQTGIQVTDWETITSHRTVRSVTFAGGRTWVGTTGGVYSFAGTTPEYQKLTNVDGLASNVVAASALDANGRLWVGLSNGVLHVIDPATETIETIVIETSGFLIQDLAIRGDDVLIASNLGISRYDRVRGEVRETYRKLGAFERDTPVLALFLDGETIWAGTDRGIARASLSSPNLQDPQFWTTYTQTDGLPSPEITGFTSLNGQMYVSTKGGVARFSSGAWHALPAGLSTPLTVSVTVWQDRIVAGTTTEVFQLGPTDVWTPLTPPVKEAVVLAVDAGGTLWAGTERDGLFRRTDSGGWESFLPNGPARNSFASLALDQSDNLWVATGDNGQGGIYMYDGERWRNLSLADGLPSMNVSTAFVDGQNAKWFGTPGDGAILISSDNQQVSVIDETTGQLFPAITEDFVVVEDFALDSRGNVWLANKFADNGKALVAVTPDFQFHYFSVSEGLGNAVISALAVDQQDRVWVGSFAQAGIRVLQWSGTLAERSDDQWITINSADGLVDNNITALAVDGTGTVWIGTPSGANFFDGNQLRNVFGLVDNFVNAIVPDAFNNKWFATRGGVSILDRDNFRLTHLTTNNSPLVDDNVFAIALNSRTGDVFLGTGFGLSRARTPFVLDRGGKTSAIVAIPNPFLLDGATTPLILGDFDVDTEVQIFSASGRWLRRLTIDDGTLVGSKAFWDGRDADGKLVASGIYIIVASTFGGRITHGKVAVVRQ